MLILASDIKKPDFFREIEVLSSYRSSKTSHGTFNYFEDTRKEKDCVTFRYYQYIFSQNLQITSSRKIKLCKNCLKAISFLK